MIKKEPIKLSTKLNKMLDEYETAAFDYTIDSDQASGPEAEKSAQVKYDKAKDKFIKYLIKLEQSVK